MWKNKNLTKKDLATNGDVKSSWGKQVTINPNNWRKQVTVNPNNVTRVLPNGKKGTTDPKASSYVLAKSSMR